MLIDKMSTDETFGFPPGYFTIRSVASNRVLDVSGDEIEDGTKIVLWPEKESSLVETMRDPDANNQVFFIDTSGALCSRSSGHAIDVEGGELVLRHRRPVSHPFPNAYAHPLPQFSYNQQTGEITVTFASDPSYPPPGTKTSNEWRNKTYVLVSIPLRRPKSVLENATQLLSNAFSSPFSRITGRPAAKAHSPDEVLGDIDLGEDEILEEEKGLEGETDDSPEPGRAVRVVGIVDKEMWDKEAPREAFNRRRWQVFALRTTNARTGI
ncbi:hypothetical protein AX16_000489 [Volvariella volvacea WC 439]|nr:hypothetical protein AX16_000489 [Volvariella volvacea WC 439]